MTEYTRLTVIGSSRKAEMVVPGDEAIGSLIPRLMELLDERPGAVSRPLTLVRSTGEQLDMSLSVSEQSVFDGELLRLLREDAAPPPPEVADVTDVLAESHDERADLWSTRSRRTVALAGIGAVAATGGMLLIGDGGVGAFAPLFVSYLAALIGAVIASRTGGRWVGSAFTGVATGVALPLGLVALQASETSVALPHQMLAVSTFAWLALALGVGAGLGRRAAWWGGVVGTLSSVLPLGLGALGVPTLGAFGVTAVVVTFVCGLLPWYAMSASGLTGLDDQVVEGRLKRRDAVLVTVNGAYRTLTWSTAAVAVPLAITSATLVASADGWAVALGLAVVVVVASRTRSMPLAAQGYALWAAALTGIVIGGAVQAVTGGLFQPWVVFVVLAAVTIAAVVVGGASLAAHQRASARRVGNLVESLAVAALLPVLVGLFGVYTELLGAFG